MTLFPAIEHFLSKQALSSPTKTDLLFLKNVAKLLGDPYRQYPSIHVAGTNGKGSVVWKVSNALIAAGYRVGSFTSPHIESFAERVAINGNGVSPSLLDETFSSVEIYVKERGISIHFFALLTLTALLLFARYQVDIAVIETGIGGRLDPTNLLSPILSVITSIDIDHCELLGHSRLQIAREKGGIIKEKVPVVLGPRAQLSILYQKATSLQAPIYPVSPRDSKDPEKENRAIAKEALRVLGEQFPCRPLDIFVGLRENLPGRFEVVGKKIYDGAHNRVALEKLLKKAKNRFLNCPIHVIFGCSNEGKLADLLDCFFEVKALYIGEYDHPRLVKGKSIFLKANHIGLSCVTYKSSKQAIAQEAVKNACLDGGLLIVTGSFYLLGEMKRVL